MEIGSIKKLTMGVNRCHIRDAWNLLDCITGYVQCTLSISFNNYSTLMFLAGMRCDANGDGEIDLEEFMHMNAAAEAEDSSNSNLLAVFEIFDGDRDGFRHELLIFVPKMGEKTLTLDECREIIHSIDKNRDRKVDFDDFETMCQELKLHTFTSPMSHAIADWDNR